LPFCLSLHSKSSAIKRVPKLLAILVVLTLTLSTFTASTVRASPAGEIIWSQTNNPSDDFDVARRVAVDGTGIYIVGTDSIPGNDEWRIEKRSLTDGSLISSFGNGGVVTSNPSSGYDAAYGVAVDASGIYIVGVDNIPGNDGWRIEKRRLDNGDIIWTVTNNPSAGGDRAGGVAVDSTGVYIVGFDESPGNYQWRIEKRSLTDGSLIASFGMVES